MANFEITIAADSAEKLRQVTKYDIAIAERSAFQASPNRFEVPAVANDTEIEKLKRDGYVVEIRANFDELSEQVQKQISDGTLFSSTDMDIDPLSVQGYLTADEINNYMSWLEYKFPSVVKREKLPWKSEGLKRDIYAVRMRGGNASKRKAVLFTAGLHGREWVPPEVCWQFMYRLAFCYVQNASLQIGNKNFDRSWIQAILDRLEIWILPLANPDGRMYSMIGPGAEFRRWRRNRREIRKDGKKFYGVDLNRNFDFLFSSGIGTEAQPSEEIDWNYRGERPASDGETKNILHLLDSNPHLQFVCDIHSSGAYIMYPWGDDENHTDVQKKDMAFWNNAWDGKRGQDGDTYKEYIPEADQRTMKNVADRMNTALSLVRGSMYRVSQSFLLGKIFRTSATLDDYAYSRHLNPKIRKNKIYAYTIECAQSWIPLYQDAQRDINDVNAAMLELCCAMVNGVTEEDGTFAMRDFDSSTTADSALLAKQI